MKLVKKLKRYVDAHCDTIGRIYHEKCELLENNFDLDLKRLQKYVSPVQVFAIWLEPIYYQSPLRQTLKVLDYYYAQIEKNNGLIGHCNSFIDITNNENEGKVSAIVSLEGGEALEGELSNLRMLYRLGVRGVTLTWNHRNQLADGVSESETNGGLTQFGKDVVKEMNRLGMLVDVSHISEAGFWDVIKISDSPVIASHSNSKSICEHRRNLTDNQLKAISEKGGVIGLNCYPPFVSKNATVEISDLILHIKHILNIAGEDAIGLGMDFDGIDIAPLGFHNVSDLEILFDLIEKNFGSMVLDKIAYKNFLRVIYDILV